MKRILTYLVFALCILNMSGGKAIYGNILGSSTKEQVCANMKAKGMPLSYCTGDRLLSFNSYDFAIKFGGFKWETISFAFSHNVFYMVKFNALTDASHTLYNKLESSLSTKYPDGQQKWKDSFRDEYGTRFFGEDCVISLEWNHNGIDLSYYDLPMYEKKQRIENEELFAGPPTKKEEIKHEDKPVVKEEHVFVAVEQPAEFVGGQAALMKWLRNNVRYPEAALANDIQGQVLVRMIIEIDGTVTNPQVLRGVDRDLDREAVRVIRAMPKWLPGKNNGKDVRSYFNLPVTFRL